MITNNKNNTMKNNMINGINVTELTDGLYYDGSNRFYCEAGGELFRENLRGIKRILRGRLEGLFPNGCDEKEVGDAVKYVVEFIQMFNRVTYSGPLAGKRRGVYKRDGDVLLATSEAEVMEPVEGECPLVEGLVDALLLDGTEEGERKKRFFYGWLQRAYLSLVNESWSAGQCLVLAGCRGGGKTLLKRLIVQLLGGRCANPVAYISEGYRFSSDLAGAECLVVDDEVGSTDIWRRKLMGRRIVGMLRAGDFRVDRKKRESFCFDPLWRMIFCTNDDPESLQCMPIMPQGYVDWMAYLQCGRWECPMPNCTYDERKEVDRRLQEELPHFLHKVLAFEIPAAERDGVFGVATFFRCVKVGWSLMETDS